MKFDVRLCEEYLGMPAEHWELAQTAVDWINRDSFAEEMVCNALSALASGDRRSAAHVCGCLQDYARRAAPEVEVGVNSAVLALALPDTIARLGANGISDDLIHAALADYRLWARAYERQFGRPGFGEIGWEINFHTGHILRHGRLQFECCTYHSPYTIYRRKNTAELLPVADPGMGVDANGFLAQGEPEVFVTQFSIDGDVLTCNRVDTASARILPELMQIDLSLWQPVLIRGMRVLNVHIPEGEPLSPEAVSESLARAKAFYADRGYPCTVAVCESWLLDPALMEYGRESGNICAFQKRFTLYPDAVKWSAAVGRVFGRGTDASDPEKLPENTSLRRGLKAYLREGKPLRDAGGVLLL